MVYMYTFPMKFLKTVISSKCLVILIVTGADKMYIWVSFDILIFLTHKMKYFIRSYIYIFKLFVNVINNNVNKQLENSMMILVAEKNN